MYSHFPLIPQVTTSAHSSPNNMKGKFPNHRQVGCQQNVVVYPSCVSTRVPENGSSPSNSYSPSTVTCQDQPRECQNSNNANNNMFQTITCQTSSPFKSSISENSQNSTSNPISSTPCKTPNFTTFQHSPQIIRWNYKKTSSPPSVISSSCMSSSNKIAKKQHSKFVNYGSNSGQLYFMDNHHPQIPKSVSKSSSQPLPQSLSSQTFEFLAEKSSFNNNNTSRRGKIKEYIFVEQLKEIRKGSLPKRSESPKFSSSSSMNIKSHTLQGNEDTKNHQSSSSSSSFSTSHSSTVMHSLMIMNTTNDTDCIHVVIGNPSSVETNSSPSTTSTTTTTTTTLENHNKQQKPSIVRTSISWKEILN